MTTEKKFVYAVSQTQFDGDEYIYKDKTIHIVSSRDEATRRARLLNQEYGEGCEFNDEHDFMDVSESAYGFHYYTVESFEVDEPMPYENQFECVNK